MALFNSFFSNLRSKDGKTLLDNFLSLSALQLLGMLLPLITLPYILRVIGFEKFGIINFAAALVAYFTSLTDFSFKLTAVREVAIFRGNNKELSLIFSKVLTIKTIFLLASWAAIALVVIIYKPFYDMAAIYFFTSIGLLGNVLFPEWFFQGIEKMRLITLINLGIKVFFTVSIFLFIKRESDYWIYPLLISAGNIGAGIVGQYLLIHKFKLKFIFLPKKMIVTTMKSNTPIFVNQFFPTIYNNSSLFLLGIFAPFNLVGIYKAILTIVNLGVAGIEILSRVFFPLLNRKKYIFPKYQKLVFLTMSLILISLLFGNKLIFIYLNLNYEYSFLILSVLSIGLIGYALYSVFGTNYFIVHNRDKLVMKNTIIASLIGFIMAFPLIYWFSILGAAINLSLARFIMGGGLYYKYIMLKKSEVVSSQ